jgi:hypothetical protein
MSLSWRIGADSHNIYRDGVLTAVAFHSADAHLIVATMNDRKSDAGILQAFERMEHKIVTALEDLQGADVVLGDAVTNLVDEQATFLTDVAAALAAAGTDPAALAAVTADLQARAQQLTSLAEAQRAADPGPPAA